jgi:CheY-like chemotaxis protein
MPLQRPRPLSISSIAASAKGDGREIPADAPPVAAAAVPVISLAPAAPALPGAAVPSTRPALAPAAVARSAASVPSQAARVATPRPAARPGGRPLPSTALLVDDSEIALRFLEKKLAPYGLVTDCVLHSDAAVERLAERRYDFVFLDMELGEHSALDGLSLCQRIKRDAVEANVVMVTAHHTELDRVRSALAGCDGFLGKPLDEQELALYLARFGVKPAANAGRVPS